MSIDSKNLTPTISKRILDRVSLLDDLRSKVLPKEDLEEHLSQNASTAGMPTWWVAGKMDFELLSKTSELGVASPEWTEYLQQDGLVFYAGAPIEEKSGDFCLEQRRQFLLRFLKDKTPLKTRLKYLVCLVIDPEKAKESFPEHLLHAASATHKSEVDPNPTSEVRRKIRNVPRDEEGRPVLPIVSKGGSIIDLGVINWENPNFHSKNYIWPVGYKCVRKLPALDDPNKLVDYVGEIQDDGSGVPKFAVYRADDESVRWEHTAASGVWATALREIKKRQTISVSGPEMFCYSDPTIRMLIQELPNSDKCDGYVWKNFSVGTNESSDDHDEPEQDELLPSHADEGASDEENLIPESSEEMSDD